MCEKYFPEPKAREKYCTRVQCLAILTANPCMRDLLHTLRPLASDNDQSNTAAVHFEQSEQLLLVCTHRIRVTVA